MESVQCARSRLPTAHRTLECAAAAAEVVAAADGGSARFAEAMAAATMELERSAAALADMAELAVVESDGGMQPAEASPLSFLERATSDLATTRRAVEQGGEVPAHFLTLTTAIYHWDDLRTILGNMLEAQKDLIILQETMILMMTE